jgi:lysophospholipid acyltransferase (LPLAT)-like uncharacterized protein
VKRWTRHVLRHPATQAALAGLLGFYLWFALRTTRWTLDGAVHAAPYLAGQRVIAAFWHERLPLMPTLWRLAWERRSDHSARVHVLVSQHRDGRFIGAVLRRFSVDVVLGSSSRGGASGVRALLGLLAAGDQIVITPDGPRGPRRVAAAGVAQIAALSGVAVLPCSAQVSRRRVMRSWDRMVVPLPFGRGVVVCGEPIRVPRQDWAQALPAIQAALNTAADRADHLCGA